MATERGERDSPAPPTKQLFPDRRRARFPSSERAWSLDDLPVAVLILDGTDVLAVNEQWTALTGLDLTSSKGEGWLNSVHRDDQAAVRDLPGQALAGDDAIGDWRLAGPGGRGRTWVQGRTHHVRGTAPNTCVMTLTEIDAHPNTDSKLVHLASHDALTGLLNRSAFIAEVEDALRRDAPAPNLTAVLFIDLDRFKMVNDRLGHQAGDTLLAVVCRRIESSLRPTESAGRLGGDEVGVLCPAVDTHRSAMRLGERIVAALEEPFTIHDEVVLIGASIGVAFSDRDDVTADGLVSDADRAMYRAKAEGGARCVAFGSANEPKAAPLCPTEVITSLAHVAVSVARGERQVNDLWYSINLRDETLAARLTVASQALHAANLALRDDHAIG